MARPQYPVDSAIVANRDGAIARRPAAAYDVKVKVQGSAAKISRMRRASFVSPIATT